MEEKKAVEMTPKKEEQQKLSYEQLERIALDFRAQANQLGTELQKAKQILAEFDVVGMLLAIIDKSVYLHDAFVTRCASRLEKLVGKTLDLYDKADDEERMKEEGIQKMEDGESH